MSFITDALAGRFSGMKLKTLKRVRAARRPIVAALERVRRIGHVEVKHVGNADDRLPTEVRGAMASAGAAREQVAPDVRLDRARHFRRIDMVEPVAPAGDRDARAGRASADTRSMNIGPSCVDLEPVFAINALQAGEPDQAPAVSSAPM